MSTSHLIAELCRHCATNTLVTQRARCVKKKKIGLSTNVLAKKYPIVWAVESFDPESSTSCLKKWQSIIWLDEQSKANYIKFIQPFLSPFVSGRAVCLSLCFAKCFDPCDKGYLAYHSLIQRR